MEKTLSVAKYLYDSYSEYFGHLMEQMKMHKLMYFVQRESLMYHKELLFEEPFWGGGMVLFYVRSGMSMQQVICFQMFQAMLQREPGGLQSRC